MQLNTRLVAAAGCAALLGCASAPAGEFADTPRLEYAQALGVDLARATRTAGGIYINEVQSGAGTAAGRVSEVRLHYTLHLPDGRTLQSTRDGEPLTVRLDDANFLIGEGVVGMRAGGRRTLVVPPSRGYGRRGVEGLVPPNATLVFVVELLEVR